MADLGLDAAGGSGTAGSRQNAQESRGQCYCCLGRHPVQEQVLWPQTWPGEAAAGSGWSALPSFGRHFASLQFRNQEPVNYSWTIANPSASSLLTFPCHCLLFCCMCTVAYRGAHVALFSSPFNPVWLLHLVL